MSSLTTERFTHLPQHPAGDPTAQALAELIALLDIACRDDERIKRARARARGRR